MKTKLIAIFLALLFVTGSTINGRSLSRRHPQMSKQSFAAGKYGTLAEIFDANGKSRFGKLTNNGFQISYEYKGKTTSVSAAATDKVNGLLPGKVTTDGQSATVTVTTSDHALEITTYFVLDEKTQKLIIQRKFRNISGSPLTLKTVREVIDPALVETGNIPADKLADKFTASRPTDDCQAADCPKGPPPCPIPCPLFAVDQAQLLAKTNPVTGRPDEIMVQWQDFRSLEQNNQVSTVVFLALPPELL